MNYGIDTYWVALGSGPLLPIRYPKRHVINAREISIVKLTERSIAALPLPAGKGDYTEWDNAMPGFGVRVRPGGKKYYVRCRAFGKQLQKPLGDVGRMTLDQARTAARQWFAQIALGINPAAEAAKVRAAVSATALTLGVTAGRYLDAKKDSLSHSSLTSARLHLEKHFAPLTSRPLADIKRSDVAAQLQVIIKERGRIAAARARSDLSSLYVWSIASGLCETNPVIGTPDPAEGVQSRDRVLSDKELAAVWNACADDDFGKIVRLLILTGCRRGEIGGLRWSEIDLDAETITIAAERSKNGKAHTLALPTMALDILRSIPRRDDRDYVFGQRGGGYSRWGFHTTALRARLPKTMPAWTLHDFRRSAATGMAEIGIEPHIVEAVLNHVSGHKAGVAGVYNKAKYTEPMRVALQRWADQRRRDN
jgi:integrase